MSIRPNALPVFLLALLVLVVGACSTPTPSPSADPTETEAVETQEPETEEPEESDEPEESEPAETDAPETEEPGGETGEFSYDDLLARIPASIIENCEAYADNDDLLITAECEMPEGSEVDYVEYTVAVDADEMNTLYEGIIDEVMGVEEMDAGVCPEDLPSEEPYNIGDAEIGRLACAIEEGGAGSMAWTDERLLIVAYARRADGDLVALHEWWTGPESGPIQQP